MKKLTRLAIAAQLAIRERVDRIRSDERGLDKIPVTAYFIVAGVILAVVVVVAVTNWVNGELAKIPAGS